MAAQDTGPTPPADRRAFLIGTAALLAAPHRSEAQRAGKTVTIGVLNVFSPDHPEGRASRDVFREALRELGYVEGQNFVIEDRWAEGRMERLPALATELVRLKVDVIVGGSTQPVRAAKNATATIPIVGWSMQDPVRDGLVASLGQPGGNVTGLTFLGPQLATKLLGSLRVAYQRRGAGRQYDYVRSYVVAGPT